jgi:hypothetical protein
VEYLLEAGANVSLEYKCHSYHHTALFLAAREGHTRIVEILIKAGANVNTHTRTISALMSAARNGWTDVVKILVEAGANINLHLYSGTALLVASSRGNTKIVKILLEANANLKLKDFSGRTAIEWAMVWTHWDVVALLNEKTKGKYWRGNFGTFDFPSICL